MSTLALIASAATLASTFMPSTSSTTTYHRVGVGGLGIFYREAGPRDAHTIVLLHGYPSSSRMFDTLIPLLAVRFHVIAPDYPGFGRSDAPPPSKYTYTFDHLAETMNSLLEYVKIDRYNLYLQDYGGPVGFRMMVAHPERVGALIIQNANAYKEGLGKKWVGIAQYWQDPMAHPEQVEVFTSLEGARQRHIAGSPNPERYSPDTWTDEYAILSRPGEREIQAELLYDYRTNIASYPKWQTWLRQHRPPTLIVWGRYDPSFISAGAEAFKRDLPDAELHLLDAGHFALDEKVDEIARLMIDFLERHSNDGSK
ncbi:MAG: alpha/beta hydrolase [Proteobacteria bacterium]|nr:alpha/beta hydrolase [Pseudomonadota bacterium]